MTTLDAKGNLKFFVVVCSVAFLTLTIPSMAVFTLFRYLREQWCTLPQPRRIEDVSSKTFLVTGSNVGLGFEASVHLANLQPKLLVATSRDQAKCELTRKCKQIQLPNL